MARSRSWTYAVFGILATAAVIGVVAFATGALPGLGGDATPVGQPSHTVGPSSPPPTSRTPSSPASTSAGSTPTSTTAGRAYAVYYVGTDPRGRPVLFREFHRGPALPAYDPGGQGGDVLTEAVGAAMGTAPLDPDYVSPWLGRATLDHASFAQSSSGAELRVALGAGAPTERPTGMSAAEARAAVQQLVYTAQAAVGTRAPVTFTIGGRTPSTLLGVDVSQPVHAGKVLDTLSLVSISDPNQGDTAHGTLTVTGANNGFEGSVVVHLERNGKRYLVTPTTGGWGGNRLYPWSVTLDVSGLRPGTYTVVAQNDDPSGKGLAPVDDRVIQVG